MQRLLLIILTALLFLACASPPWSVATTTAAPAILSASEIDYPPYCQLDESGKADGFSVELLRAALKEMGKEVAFSTGPWAQVKQALIDGRVDVLPLVGRTPEREALFDFTVPYLTMHGTLVVRDDDEEITTLADLQGKKIAVMLGDNAEEFVRRSQIGGQVVTTPTFVEALAMLARGEADAVIMQKLLFYQLARQNNLTDLKAVGQPLADFKQTFCFAVHKGDHDLLQVLNEGLSIVKSNGTFDRLYRTWIAPIENPRQWKSRIIVGGDDNYPPYEYLDENRQPAGYNVELSRAIARQMGMDIEIVLKPWAQIRDDLESGKIDVVQGMFYSPERDEELDFSPSHARVGHVVVARNGVELPETLEDLAGRTVAVMAGDITHDLLLQSGEAGKIITAASQEDVLALLANGECDYALVARLPALYWIRQHGWDNLRLGETPIIAPEYCFAASQENAPILALFTEGLNTLQQSGDYRQIHARTLGVYETSDLKPFRYLMLFCGILLALLVMALAWTRTLKRQVWARTAELETEIAERKRLIERISEREQTINLLLDSTAEGIYGVDSEGICIFFNKAAQQLLGYDDRRLLGRSVHNLIAHTNAKGEEQNETACLVRQVIATGRPYHNNEAIFWREDGSWIDVEYFIHPILNNSRIEGAVITFTDITEKKKLEEQRIRTAQLSSLGELAAGVAHEINNPVGGVINYAQILLNKHAKSDLEKTLLGNIIKEGDRIATIVGTLLSYVHKDRSTFKRVAIEEIIWEPVSLLRQQLAKDGIAVDVHIEEDIPAVYGNAQKLEQVLLNLISNARYTLNDKYAGAAPDKILRISAMRAGSDESTRVRVTVWDQGKGIAKENLKRIFNRFYTTKPAGSGTGLGLSIVHDILEEHGAQIEIESEEGLYTKVQIDFPIALNAQSAA